MEVYILDEQLRRIEVVDDFESLIWTERWAEIGDFELHLHSTSRSRKLFADGTKLATNTSYYVMVVESSESKTDDQGLMMLTVKGRSLEKILEDRIVRWNGDPYGAQTWTITDTPANIARTMFKNVCVDGNIHYTDVIPYIQPGSLFPASTIPEPATIITVDQPPDILYNPIKGLCDRYSLGFRLIRNFDKSELYFDIYTGDDRTSKQNVFEPVVFSQDLENLQNVTQFRSSQATKNVAYVLSPNYFFRTIFADGIHTDLAGFDRRIALVIADDVTDGTPNYEQVLFDRGKEELAKYRDIYAFDGEIDQRSNHKYGLTYNLGDLVELRDEDDITSPRLVTEQIFAQDREGERSYPTLSVPNPEAETL